MNWLNPDIIAYDKVRVFVDHDFPGYKNVYSFGDFTVILKDGTKEFAYGPPLDHICSVSFVCWEGLTLALCAHRVDAGERVGAQGTETPRYSSCVLIGLSSPQQRRVAIFLLL